MVDLMGKTTESTKLLIAEMRERGCSYGVISRKTGLSVGTIEYWCLELGAESPRNSSKPLRQTAQGPSVVKRLGHTVRQFSASEDEQLLSWRQQNVSLAECARRLERRHNSVRGRLMTLARHQDRSGE